jgi:hypothetical protein
MNDLQNLYYVSQIVAGFGQCILMLAAIGAAMIAYNQFFTSRLFEILRFTQDEKFRDSRRIVIQQISTSIGQQWWDDKFLEIAASTCCANYDILGHVLQFSNNRRVSNFFADRWSDSIVRTYVALETFMDGRAERGGIHYPGYRWLYAQARQFRQHPGELFPNPPSVSPVSASTANRPRKRTPSSG